MDFDQLIARHSHEWDDFWGRRPDETWTSKEFRLFGRRLRLNTNDPRLVEALTFALRAFSIAPAIGAPANGAPPFVLEAMVRPAPWAASPPPTDLYPNNVFAGRDNWLMIQLGEWGHAHVDLASGRATAVLTPELAAEPTIVARGLLHTVLTNLLIGSGHAMLHCSGLVHNGRLLLLLAPHNSGKSTTALRLVAHGYQLLSDSQIYVLPDHQPLTVAGFPVGRTRLRRDMVPEFPQFAALLRPEEIRDEMKFAFNLRDFEPALVFDQALAVDRVDLCLLQRHDAPPTVWTPADDEAVWTAVMTNSIFYDQVDTWRRNLAVVAPLIERAQAYHLTVGNDPVALVAAVDDLGQQPASPTV